MEEKNDKKGLLITVSVLFVISVIAISAIFGMAAQFNWVVNYDFMTDITTFHTYLVIGIIVIALVTIIVIGVGAVNMSRVWNNEACKSKLGDLKIPKVEMFFVLGILLGVLAGTGLWDVIMVIHFLLSYGWSYSTWTMNVVVFSFPFYTIVWQLWIQAIVGTTKFLIGVIIALVLASRVNMGGHICEPLMSESVI